MRRLIPLLTLALPLCLAAAPLRAEGIYLQQKNIVYAEVHGIGLVMDVFIPTAEKNGLGIIDVISGAWHSDRGKIRDHQQAQMYDIFCGRGYTVFAVRPGSVSKFTGLEMLDHLQQGIRWVKEHAAEYGVNPARLGLTGASAGGHLASLAAVAGAAERSMDTSVHAVGVFFPPTDLIAFAGGHPDLRDGSRMSAILRAIAFNDRLEGVSDDQIAATLTKLSPALCVSGNEPPFLLIHGDADTVVPLQQSQMLLEALKSKGVAANLIVKEGGGHPWPTIHEEVAVLADWFDEQLASD